MFRLSRKTYSTCDRENKDNYIHLSYQDFIDSPSKKIKDILDFFKLDYTENWINKISENIKRKNPETKKTEDKSLLAVHDLLNCYFKYSSNRENKHLEK